MPTHKLLLLLAIAIGILFIVILYMYLYINIRKCNTKKDSIWMTFNALIGVFTHLRSISFYNLLDDMKNKEKHKDIFISNAFIILVLLLIVLIFFVH